MKKISLIAPLACAFVWAVCLLLAVFCPTINYRIHYILAVTILVVTYLMIYMKENERDREAERLNYKSGQKSEPDSYN